MFCLRSDLKNKGIITLQNALEFSQQINANDHSQLCFQDSQRIIDLLGNIVFRNIQLFNDLFMGEIFFPAHFEDQSHL
jgi:hypothetical protein